MVDKYLNVFLRDKRWILLMLIFFLHLFLRFYELESRTSFGWDQVNNAWVAKDIIVDHKLPLLGPWAKGISSGIRLGPAYYYLITPFYWIFKLDPITSGVFAGIVSIFTFFTLFYVCKKLLSFNVAIIAVFINTVAFNAITFDRMQWNVNFIPAVSFLIFYFLYKVITGNEKFLIPLAIAIGLFFHIHLTAVVFPLVVLFCLPFFPKTKKTLKYIFVSFPFFLIWLVPNIMANSQSAGIYSANLVKYLGTYYHGIHLTRIVQLTSDAFIQFESFLIFEQMKPLKFILPFAFAIMWISTQIKYNRFILPYLTLLWFIVPWIVLSTYSGEISDYYFSVNRFIALMIIAFVIAKIVEIRNRIFITSIVLLLLSYAVFNINRFLNNRNSDSLTTQRKDVLRAINEGRFIEFEEGVGQSYLYYLYKEIRKD